MAADLLTYVHRYNDMYIACAPCCKWKQIIPTFYVYTSYFINKHKTCFSHVHIHSYILVYVYSYVCMSTFIVYSIIVL